LIHFFQDSLEEQHSFERTFCNNVKVFTVTIDLVHKLCVLTYMIKLLCCTLNPFEIRSFTRKPCYFCHQPNTFKDGKWISWVWVDSRDIPPLATEKS